MFLSHIFIHFDHYIGKIQILYVYDIYAFLFLTHGGLNKMAAILQKGVGERERLSLSAFLRTEDIGVHIVHISRLIITYTLE